MDYTLYTLIFVNTMHADTLLWTVTVALGIEKQIFMMTFYFDSWHFLHVLFIYNFRLILGFCSYCSSKLNHNALGLRFQNLLAKGIKAVFNYTIYNE